MESSDTSAASGTLAVSATSGTDSISKVSKINVAARANRRRAMLLGYLFILPALVVTAVFGLYPVISGLSISLQGGIILPEGYIGLENYIQAIGSLAYLLGLIIALVLLLLGYRLFRTTSLSLHGRRRFYPYLLPGALAALATLLLVGAFFSGIHQLDLIPVFLLLLALVLYGWFELRQHGGFMAVFGSWGVLLLMLGAVLLIAFTFSEIDRVMTPALIVLGQATHSFVMPLSSQFAALLGTTVCLGAFFVIQRPGGRGERDQPGEPGENRPWALWRAVRWIVFAIAVLLVIYIIGCIELLRASIVQLGRVTPTQLAALSSLTAADLVQTVLTWPQVFTIVLGTALVALAFYLWMGAARRQTTPGTLAAIGTAILLMVGGWMLIGQLPQAAASGDPDFYQSLLRTATYAVLTVPVQLSLGILLAYLLFYEVRRGKSFYRVVFFIPYVAPSVATAAVFAVIFSLDKSSPANQILHLLGIPAQQWLRDTRGVFEIIAQLIGGRQVHLPSLLVGPSLPLTSAVLYAIWLFSGYDSVIFLAGLGNVPPELVEASQVDGAGRWAIFRHIIFPMISPTTFFLSMLAIIGTFKTFDTIYVLRQADARGAMDTATIYIFELIRTGSKSWSYAASAAFILFGIILVLTLLENRLSRDRVFYG